MMPRARVCGLLEFAGGDMFKAYLFSLLAVEVKK